MKNNQDQVNSLADTPYSLWVYIAFFICFFLFFVKPVFLTGQEMHFFLYIPTIKPIGADLRQILSYSNEFIKGNSPYIGMNLYPPLASILFSPLLSVNFAFAYKIITVISVLCFLSITFVLPVLVNRNMLRYEVLSLIGVTGLFSYGFQFELERGQFNVIAMFIAILGVWIYRQQSRYRYFGLVLLTIAVQLKIYPFLLILLLVKDLRVWREYVKDLALFVAINFALLFLLGKNAFLQFVHAIITQSIYPQNWTGNHSIRSYVIEVLKPGQNTGFTGTSLFSTTTQITLLLITLLSILIVFLVTSKSKQSGLNSPLLLTCTLGMLIIPSVSHDYTLSLLPGSIGAFFANEGFFINLGRRQKILSNLISFIISLSYFSTCFSFTNKPPILTNNFSALLLILVLITFLISLNQSRSFTE